ncbi:MAG: NuoM family protein [Thiohalomonadaceae bacterium]
MTLAALLLVLIAGGVLAWWSESRGRHWPRRVGMGAIVIALALALMLPSADGGWRSELRLPWIPRFGITLHLAADGLSIPLVLLTLVLGAVAALVAWQVRERPGFFQFNLLWSLAGMVGVFVALDLFLFFVFWEVMLVPMYFLIALWGHEQRQRAGMKFFVFTQAGGLMLLAAIVGLVLVAAAGREGISFDYFDLLGVPLGEAAPWLAAGFLAAFLVKLPAVPLHSWLPDAHTQAPTAGSVLLAGVLLKTGGYGLLRFVLPLFPGPMQTAAPFFMALGVVAIVYGAVLAFAQQDVKRLVAYTSVSHMGFVLLAVFAWNVTAWQGALVQMLAHGLATGALFVIAGALQDRLHSRDLGVMGGLTAQVPRLTAFGMFFAVAAFGLPGLGTFLGEFLSLLGAFQANVALAAVAASGMVLSAIYALSLVQRAFHGEPRERALRDLGRRETGVLAFMAVGLLWLGLAPQPVLALAAVPLQWLAGIR